MQCSMFPGCPVTSRERNQICSKSLGACIPLILGNSQFGKTLDLKDSSISICTAAFT